MSDQPEDAESNNEGEVPRVLSNEEQLQLYEDYGNRFNSQGFSPAFLEALDLLTRENTYTKIRLLDLTLGRNFRNLVRGKILKGIRDCLPPKKISYLNEVSMEELIQFLRSWNQEQWNRTTTSQLNAYIDSAREIIDSTNEAISSYQQWDVNDHHECFEDILKDVFY
ncbi:hypothetical protein B9Z55_025783 [Caenorhabditis nigoni]|nr:hypothetical protein B9Z55_025783 [Caenorhabditis nigoni]